MRWNSGAHPHADKHGAGKHGFQNGNPATGTPASIDDAIVYDDLFANVAHACETAGFLTPTRKQDLYDAICQLARNEAGGRPGDLVLTMRAAPVGRQLATNGALISRTTFAGLFAEIGTTFGVGDGATTFALPTLDDVFLRILGGGRALGSLQLDAMQNHWHQVKSGAGAPLDEIATYDSLGPGFNQIAAATNSGTPGGIFSVRDPRTDGINGAPRTAAETRPKNVAVNGFIFY